MATADEVLNGKKTFEATDASIADHFPSESVQHQRRGYVPTIRRVHPSGKEVFVVVIVVVIVIVVRWLVGP